MQFLNDILRSKQDEISRLIADVQAQANHPIAQVLRGDVTVLPRFSFAQYIASHTPGIIAECKRVSPSKGFIRAQADLFAFYQQCQSAVAFSIHTDVHFASQLEELIQITHHRQRPPKPILRKDFIITEYQISESLLAGSDAVLLIVAALGKKNTKAMLTCAQQLGIDALVEIHTEAELELALHAGAQLIAVNNRDLHTFKVYPERALELRAKMPNDVVTVAASGIQNKTMAHDYFRAGYHAVLIGEALSQAECPEQFIQECYRV